MKKILVIFYLFVISISLIATDVSGNQSGTWGLTGSPYNVIGEIVVPTGETLEIEAGVEVIAMGNYKITALGNIIAEGTENDTIRFYGNGGLDWGGLRLEDETIESYFDYCRISNTDDTNDYGIHSINSPVLINHSFFDDHQKAISFSALSATTPSYMEIKNSKIANVQKSGIAIVDNSNVLIDSCEVTQCGLGPSFYGAIQLSLQSNSSDCSPTISNSYIHHNDKQGITMGNLFNYNEMAPTVENNEISYNYTGIYLYNGKGHYEWNHIHHNFVENNPDSGAGVMLYGSGANGTFTYNIITGNYTGFYLASDATANLGDLENASTDDDGYNCIYDNIFYTGEEYSVYNSSAMDVKAENTVWDTDPPIDVTIIDGNDNPAYGIVDYEPTLSPFAPPDSAYISDYYFCYPIGWKYYTYAGFGNFPGWNLYIDGTFEAFVLLGEMYQLDLSMLIIGQTYTLGMTYIYENGESIATEVEFTYLPGNPGIVVDPTFIYEILASDEIIVVPLTITNTGDAELTYDITIVEYTSDQYKTKNHKSSYRQTRDLTQTKVDPAFNEQNPDLSNHVPLIPPTDDLFDLQFQFPVGVGGGEAGIETDGNYIYTTKWNGAVFYRYAMDGTYIEEFSVTGCPGNIRDLAYDGQYFYGAAANTTVYEMDFDTQTVVSTITAPIAVVAIAYDEVNDGFWANNWSDQITLFGRDGATLDSFPCGVFQSCYGLAWEDQLDGGPYLWAYFQDGPTLNQLVQFDIATGLQPGPSLDIGSIFNVGTGIAGGLCISNAFVPGTWTICGTAQDVIIWGVELSADESWISVNPGSGTVPAGEFVIIDVTLDASDVFNFTNIADIVIANNAGDDVIVPVTMEVWGPCPFDPPENVQVDEYTGLVTWEPPGGTIYGDDFESYNVGEYLAVQSNDWTTWSNNPGSGEDAYVSDDYALSGTNSVKVEGSTNLLLIMDNYTSGCYSMDLNMYIVSGNTASFNLQKTNIPGEQWAMEIYFDVNGEARVDAGVYAACVFPFDFDTWLNFEIIVDLDNDLGEVWFNGTQLHTWQWTLTSWGIGLLSLGGLNLWAWDNGGGPALAYYDDITFSIINAEPSDELTGYNVYLDDEFIIYTTELQYQYTGLVYNQTYTAGVSAVYDDPGESIIVEVVFCLPGGITHPENLVAFVFDYNDVHLEWEQPVRTDDVLYTRTRTKRIENNRDSRMLLGYKVYRDGVEIVYLDDPNELTYDDLALNEGTYDYWVTAIYDEGESDSSNVEEVTVVLYPPLNLSAIVQGMNNVFLTWDAPATRELESYNVYRNGDLISNVTSTFYLDEGVAAGNYVYNVTAVYGGGWESGFSNNAYGSFDVGDTPIPLVTELMGNYPNPFNPTTIINYSLKENAKVSLNIYNIKGQKVKQLISNSTSQLSAGQHSVVWDGRDENNKPVGSGIYFYKMKTDNFEKTKKMILLK